MKPPLDIVQVAYKLMLTIINFSMVRNLMNFST